MTNSTNLSLSSIPSPIEQNVMHRGPMMIAFPGESYRRIYEPNSEGLNERIEYYHPSQFNDSSIMKSEFNPKTWTKLQQPINDSSHTNSSSHTNRWSIASSWRSAIWKIFSSWFIKK